MSISPAQSRAARALIEIDQADLARVAVVHRDVVIEFENGGRMPSRGDLAAIRKALEGAGVVFIEEDGEGGPWGKIERRREVFLSRGPFERGRRPLLRTSPQQRVVSLAKK
jgi:hypothetical protein